MWLFGGILVVGFFWFGVGMANETSGFVNSQETVIAAVSSAVITTLICLVLYGTRVANLKDKTLKLEEEKRNEKEEVEKLNDEMNRLKQEKDGEIDQLQREIGDEKERARNLSSTMNRLRKSATNETKHLYYWVPVKLYSKRPIGREAFEYAFLPIEAYLKEHRPSCRLFAEVGLGGFIDMDENCGTKDEQDDAFRRFGCKRADFLVINHDRKPILAIEYDGTGHYTGQEGKEEKEGAKKKREEKAMALKVVNIPLVIIDQKEERQSVLTKIAKNLP